MSAPRRYYPGFFGALFLILLRTAIGWHFFHEGHTKLYPEGEDSAGFSAETYLRNANGPLAPRFRALLSDPFATGRLDPKALKTAWRAELHEFAKHYGFDEAQRREAEQALRGTEAKADAWFGEGDTLRKLHIYRKRLNDLERLEKAPPALSFERERADETRKKIESERKELVNTVDAWTGALRDSWTKTATTEQKTRAGVIGRLWTRLDVINVLTEYGLMAVGVCLMLGLLTPVAALGAAGFLAMFYLSMPPWPGLPPSPMSEGHYLYVNKNLIELLACLVLASTPNGLWLGLDALLFGWIARKGRPVADTDADAENEGADPLARSARNFRSL